MRPAKELPSRASVVIVGGGVMGTSIAFHLVEAGVEDVVLIERGELGQGSTVRAAGGVRAQFSDALNIQIAQRSLRAFTAFGTRPGWEIDLDQVGYLFLLTREEDVSLFERNVALQTEYGVPSRMLEPREVATLNPLVETGDVLAAAFSPDDGHATPEGVVQGYAGGARAGGAHIATNCELLGIEVDGGEIRAVKTDRGEIQASSLICCAGAWSRQVGEMAGVDLPVEPLRRQILFTEPIPDLPRRLPMTIDFESTFYFHREGPGLLMGMSWRGEEPGFNLESTDDWIPDLLTVMERRAPRVAKAGIKGGWAGLYENTPDHNALVGEAEGPSRFLYATGFSGHGFLQGPAVGEIIRDLYLDRTPFVDVSALSAARFALGDSRPEYNIV
ncbi:MAG: FAD-binding oxidoreductase [Actinobacteria bacterium]|nr:FAD-binding oxidoreductase [Actinomycetota bacterium]